jgi:hypothetical protein|tara:strand:- start:1379 stop:2269 length:891 start_codon:yes stop_codon:yes gene_type:complete
VNNQIHTAGIIPVANLETDIETPIPEILLPVGNGFTAIQKSVFECALAGCNTIWIVANNDLAPIIRKVVGDWIYDPVYYERTFTKFYSDHRREIPIYYVPIHPKDRDRRDSYGWSILYGVYSSWYTAYKISKWITPQNYYISFPMSTYDIYSVRNYRKVISSSKANFFLKHNNQTVKDGKYLSFTMKGRDFKACRNLINKTTTREFLPPLPDQKYPTQKRPIQDRWTAKSFSLEQVLIPLSEEGCAYAEIDWYHDISTWDGYVEYLGSEKSIESPRKQLTSPHTHGNIPYVDETQD